MRNGEVYINESILIEKFDYGFIWEKAPRVAIGHDAEGNLLIFEVDGNEFLNKGNVDALLFDVKQLLD